MNVTLDTETYPNCFILVAQIIDTPFTFTFEISDRIDQSEDLYYFLNRIDRAYGFNLLGFDGPIIHMFMRMGGKCTPKILYDKAQAIIDSQDTDKWAHSVYPSDRAFEWVDLYRINHFNNKARTTSLKALEFNMRMDDIRDLPFKVGTVLTHNQIQTLREYCAHDVRATEMFRVECLNMITFREELGKKYDKDFMNADDVKIGSTIFEIMLTRSNVELYEYSHSGRTPRQTPRPVIHLKDAIPPWIEFDRPEFNRTLAWLKQQSITETKGVFKDLTTTVDGFTVVFGLGGIHGSVENMIIESDDEVVIESVDVSSMYPNISIANRFYPEHLGETFCDVYKQIYDLRKTFAKDTVENAAYKLAANGTYGKTNDKFSPFYDPLFTIKITLTGQMVICMLIEKLLKVPSVALIMTNTDGLEYTVHVDYIEAAKSVCSEWEKLTGLVLERARYQKMFIRDCNNYIAVYENGKVKRKGAYEYVTGWHQNAGGLVVPKVAEKVLIEGAPIVETVRNWPDLMDFMLRTKVPRTGYLQWGKDAVQNVSRYYVAENGKPLTKWLPPLKGKTDWRSFAIESGWGVQVCNRIEDAVLLVDYNYYIQEVEKLILRLT